MTRVRLPLLLALPGLALGAAGVLHPHHLTYDTARSWFGLHLAGLVVFPLVGLALMRVVAGRRDPLAWLVRLAAYGYATFYTALDVVSGLAAGWVTRRIGPGVPRPEEVSLLFRLGTPIGEVGSVALLVAVVALTLDLARRRPRAALLGLLLVPGAWLVHTDHIFAPQGAIGMVLIGVGTGLAGLVQGQVVTLRADPDATDRP